VDQELIRRIKQGAKWMPGFKIKPIPPRLSVLARFIEETWPDLRVTLRPWTTNTDAKIGRLRWPGKERKGKLLEVRDPQLGRDGLCDRGLILRHESGDAYRHNGDVCQWIVKRLEEDEKCG